MYSLALKVTEFYRDTDAYGFDDAYGYEGGFNDAVDDNYELLIQFDDSIIDYLESIIADNNDYSDRAIELKNEILKEWF